MWAYEYIQLCMPKPEKRQLFAQKQALGGSLFYLWFSLLLMFYPVSVQAGNPVNKQTNVPGQIKQVFSLRVPALQYLYNITLDRELVEGCDSYLLQDHPDLVVEVRGSPVEGAVQPPSPQPLALPLRQLLLHHVLIAEAGEAGQRPVARCLGRVRRWVNADGKYCL